MPAQTSPLKVALAAYCREAQSHLVDLVSSTGDPPTRTSYTVTFASAALHSITPSTETDWGRVASENAALTRALPSYAVALELLSRDPSIASHIGHLAGTARSRFTVTAELIVDHLLASSAEAHHDGLFDAASFDALFDGLRRFFDSDRVSLHALAPLNTFWMEGDDIDLGHNLRLRKLSPEEHNRLLRPPSAQIAHFDMPRFALEYDWSVPKQIDDNELPGLGTTAEPEPHDVLGQVLDALRLFKPGSITLGRVETRHRDWTIFGTMGTGGMGVVPFPVNGPYRLSAAEASEFLSFWGWYRAMSHKKRMTVCLRRFRFGYERSRIDDRLVDHVIALEALLDDGDRQELAYRFAFRAAALLATDADDREATFKRMRCAYIGRSRIVHGATAEAIPLNGLPYSNVGDFHRAFESDVRRAIVAFLRLSGGCSEQAVVEQLETRIVRGDYAPTAAPAH